MIKDDEISRLVNNLRQVSIECHDHQSLREQISRLVIPTIQSQNEEIERLRFLVTHGRHELFKKKLITFDEVASWQ